MGLADWIDDIINDPGTPVFSDPGSSGGWGSLGGNYANIQPTTNMSSTGSFNQGGTDWSGLFQNTLKLLPNVISSIQGHPYGSGPQGQQSAPYGGAPQGGGVYAGGSFLGASGFGSLSGTTLILIGLAVFFVLKRK